MRDWLLVGGAGLVGLLGVILVGIAAVSWLRPNPKQPSRTRPIVFGVAGAVCVLLAILAATQMKSLRPDYSAPPEVLEELKNAQLALPRFGSPAADEYWPQWRGPYRDGISDETGLNLDWNAQPPRILWSKAIGGGYSSIAVVGKHLYTMDKEREGGGDRERILCFHADTGDLVWKYEYEADYRRIDYGEGPRATPTIHEGRLYALGATGILTALELPKEGESEPRLLWNIDLMKEFDVRPAGAWWGMACSPLIMDDLVIVQPGGRKGSIAAFDRISGKIRWWSANTDPSGYSSPVAAVIAGKLQLVCFTGRRLVGLEPEHGKELWTYDWATQYDCNIATPIVVNDYIFISTNYSTAMDSDSGCAMIKIESGGRSFTVRRVFELRRKVMRNHMSTCVFHGGHLYGCDTAGHGSDRSELVCLDFRTMEVKWSKEFNKCSLIAAEGHLIVLDQDGRLTLVEATPGEFRPKGSLKVLPGRPSWSPPALAQGRLYLRNNPGSRAEIACVDLRKKTD